VLATHDEMSYYHWPYPELPGSKAEFYAKAVDEAFEKDAENLPFEKVLSSPKGISSVSLDLRQVREYRKNESPILGRLPIEIAENENQIQGFEYWGLFRYRTLGLLAICYGVEGI
jgi:hypothetical protein